MARVPTAHFDYRKFSPAERLPAWRHLTESLYQTWAQGDPLDFTAEVYGYQVGELVFNQPQFSPARFLRGAQHVRGESRDFLTLQVQLSGEERVICPHGQIRIMAGHIYLRDWAYEFDSEATAMRQQSIIIPRHRLNIGTAGHGPQIMSWSMAEPAGRALSMLCAQLFAELPDLDLSQAQGLCDALLGFINALLQSSRTAEVSPVTRDAIQQFLSTRLRDNIGVEYLCEQFGISRSTLYRMFERLGGVRNYIIGARLDRCYSDLRLADRKKTRVADVAIFWGFTEASSFTRAFRNRFGVPPSRVLGAVLAPEEAIAAEPESTGMKLYRDYLTWLDRASGIER